MDRVGEVHIERGGVVVGGEMIQIKAHVDYSWRRFLLM